MGLAWKPLTGQSHAIALALLTEGPLTRTELADRLDLSAGSLTRLAQPLIRDGLIVEAEEPVAGLRMGRPPRPLDVRADAFRFVGVKVTSSRLYGVLTTLRAEILQAVERPLDGMDPDSVVAAVVAVVHELRQHGDGVEAIGVTVGGDVSGHRAVTISHILRWSGVPLADLVAAATGLPTVVANDLVGLTEAESWFGAGRGLEQFALVTIGAGIGYSYVVRRHQVTQTDSGLGSASHLPLDPTGPVCRLGHRGCALAWLSSGSIAGSVTTALGRPVTYEEALDLAEQHDPAASRIVRDSAHQLGRALGMVASLTMPDALLLGGEGVRLASVGRREMDEGIAAVRDPAASPVNLLIRPAGFVEWARGAAVIAIQQRVLHKV